MKKIASLLVCLFMLLTFASCLPENDNTITEVDTDKVVSKYEEAQKETDGQSKSSNSDSSSTSKKQTSSTVSKTIVTEETKQKVEDKLKDAPISLSENTDWGSMDNIVNSKDFAENIIEYDDNDPAYRKPYVYIKTPEDLMNLSRSVMQGSNYSACNVQILNDLDMTGIEWIPLGTPENPFRGSIDGNKHTIKNLSISKINESAIDSDGSAYLGFLGVHIDAAIFNLNIENISINVRATENSPYVFAGGIAGYYSSYTLSSPAWNVKVSGNINIKNPALGVASVGGVYGVANFVGYEETLELDRMDSKVNMSVDGFYTITGGIVGSGSFDIPNETEMIFTNFTYNGTINDKSNLSFVGGFCGLCNGYGTPTFRDSSFSTTVKRVLDNETSEDIQILGIIAGGIDVYTDSFTFENINGNIIYNGKICDSAFCGIEQGKVVYNSCTPNIKLPN